MAPPANQAAQAGWSWGLGCVLGVLCLGVDSCGGEGPRGEPADMRHLPSGSTTAPEAAPGSTASGLTQLKLATWNLEWLNAQENSGVVKRTATDYRRLQAYAKQLDADVIAFQEVDGEQAALKVFDQDIYKIHVASEADVQRTGFAFRRTLTVTENPDYEALDVGGVRRGADITVSTGARKLRLLSVHLKSGCFNAALDVNNNACQKLSQQLPVLETWIDARAADGVFFGVLGDFNRQLFQRPDEPFWLELDDGEPAEADLDSPTRGQLGQCWEQEFPQLIDHIVLGKSTAMLVVAGSFTQHLYNAADKPHKRVLSDHCPLSVVLQLPEPTHGEVLSGSGAPEAEAREASGSP
jgi:endonuclease/exonuclease/phosphatase family metal-dependent hydrolase